ncbi:NAD(P)H-hydrate dehydratase [Palleronia caenipelagi]|uniref:Bifunctional NAD(P)H-hydrate repair enzyme n=2 Tax=Palleronia caenipelagi TaxID=2489174 RepID=A0A547PLQ7_9RHOB|nr:NAD(P)H-hydrate dehydratase [Palleronia caenipelagi]TRD15081.1 NAD(P)H-hydrate dehydratase [Palleronia caenipelagi]
MRPESAVTTAEMRKIEADAIESGSVTGLDLMERAGAGAVSAARERLMPDPAGKRVLILCGPGNNGGDGYVIARILHDLDAEIELRALGAPGQGAPDALANRKRWLEIGTVMPLDDSAAMGAQPDLVIDALFGTGLARGVDPAIFDPVRARIGAAPIIAVDLPSGLCSDSGQVIGAEGGILPATLTVSFHRPKRGHYLRDGPRFCGALAVCDIGLGATEGAVRLVRAPDGLGKGHGHKFSYGHALVLSGGMGQSGAARLAARAALRVGAGLVTIGAPAEAMPEIAAQITALMLRRVDDAGNFAGLLDDPRINALCLGPGLGLGPREAALIGTALVSARPAVLDADALTLIAADPELRSALHPNCVLTPHEGEFARLFPDIADRSEGPGWGKPDLVAEAARRSGCVILLKGPDTVIATPEGNVMLHAAAYERAAPWLATAGSGDVLAGLIAGLLARGAAPAAAAQTGVWLHTEAARHMGAGLIAEDLPDLLPRVLQDL